MMRLLAALAALLTLTACAAPQAEDLSVPDVTASAPTAEPVVLTDEAAPKPAQGYSISLSKIIGRKANPVSCQPSDDGIGGTGCPDQVAQRPQQDPPHP